MTVVVKNNLNNSANNSATSNSNNTQTTHNVSKVKFVEERASYKPVHHSGHEHEVQGGGKEHQGGHHHHSELAQTGAQGTPILIGLSAALLAAGAAAMRFGRRRA